MLKIFAEVNTVRERRATILHPHLRRLRVPRQWRGRQPRETFYYHMHGSNMGTLLVINAAEEAVWSLSGNQGDLWTEVTVAVHSPSRRRSASSIYTRGNGWEGDAALA